MVSVSSNKVCHLDKFKSSASKVVRYHIFTTLTLAVAIQMFLYTESSTGSITLLTWKRECTLRGTELSHTASLLYVHHETLPCLSKLKNVRLQHKGLCWRELNIRISSIGRVPMGRGKKCIARVGFVLIPCLSYTATSTGSSCLCFCNGPRGAQAAAPFLGEQEEEAPYLGRHT